MHVGTPLLDAMPGARGRLLAVLVRFERSASPHELALHAGVDPRHCGRLVDDLLAAGLVSEARAGHTRLISLNRDHLAYAPIAELAAIPHRLVERLRTALEPVDMVAGAWLFGSAARGDGDRDSDIDILLVYNASALDDSALEAFAETLRDDVSRWTGNDIQLVEHTVTSFAEISNSSIIEEIRRDGVSLVQRGAGLLRDLRTRAAAV